MAAPPIPMDAYYPLSTSIPAAPGQSDFLRWMKDWVSDGIMRGDLDSLGVSQAATGADLSIDVAAGRGINRGVFWESGTAKNIAIASNGSGFDRIDRLVVRLTAGTPNVAFAIVTGAAAATPEPPAVTRTVVNGVPVVHDLYVAQIRVRFATSSILNADITDERQFLTGYGYRYWGTLVGAATVTLPDVRQLMVGISGTATITAIPANPDGCSVTMVFLAQGCTVVHNGTTIVLDGGRNYVSRTNGTLTLRSNGSAWFEVGRTKEQATQNLVLASPHNTTGEVNLIALGTGHLPTGIPAANLAADVSRPNMLINGGFEIWQRGNGAFAVSNSYTADRWVMTVGAGSGVSIVRNAINPDVTSRYCLSVTYAHTSNSQVKQSVENWRELVGQTITFAIRVASSVAGSARVAIDDGVGGTIGTSHSGSSNYETLFVTHTVAAGATGVTCYVEFVAGGSFLIDNATLVIGSVASTYKPLDTAADLARCLRYYELIGAQQLGDTGTGAIIIAGAAPGVSVTLYKTFVYAAKKAIADPTTTKNGTWIIANTLAAVQPSVTADDSTGVRLQVASAIVTGEVYAHNGAASANLAIEANP